MKAIIMAGGEGSRLKLVTGGIPKPMTPLLGKPLMERIIQLLAANGVTDICVSLRYNPAPILDYFGDGGALGVRLEYRIEKEPLGTAGGVKNCEELLNGGDFLVISGDAACDFDLRRLIAQHKARSADVTMALAVSGEPLQYGLVLTDGDGFVRQFIEKPDWEHVVTNLVNTGIYVMSPDILELIPAGRSFDFASDLFPLLTREGGRIAGVEMDGYWCDVGTPETYYRCCLDALGGRLRLSDFTPSGSASGGGARLRPLYGGQRLSRSLPCADRAGLMRALSGAMMEAGADFSDGLSVYGSRCGLRVRPDPGKSALIVDAASDDADFTRSLSDAAMWLAKELDARR